MSSRVTEYREVWSGYGRARARQSTKRVVYRGAALLVAVWLAVAAASSPRSAPCGSVRAGKLYDADFRYRRASSCVPGGKFSAGPHSAGPLSP